MRLYSNDANEKSLYHPLPVRDLGDTWKRSNPRPTPATLETDACHTREGTTIEFAGSKIVRRGIPTYQRTSPLFLAENRAFR